MSRASEKTIDSATVRMAIDGTFNFREVLASTADGQKMRPGMLYRSDALHALTDDGRRALAKLNLKLILDLRSDDETRAEPDELGDLEVPVKHLAILGGSVQSAVTAIAQGKPDKDPLATMYCLMLDADGTLLGEAVRAIATAGGPVDVHCTAGKDRTGVVVALTLLAIGVREQDIVANYALTGTNLAGAWLTSMQTRIQAYGYTLDGPLLELVAQSPASAIETALAWIREQHGTPIAYLDSIGVDANVRSELERALLIET